MNQKHIIISEIKSLFFESFNLIKNNPLIYALSLFVSLSLLIPFSIKPPRIIYFLPILILIGWEGTQADLIYKSYQKQKLPWNKIGNLLFKYFKKTIPLYFFFILIFFLIIFLTIVMFIIKKVSGIEINFTEILKILLMPTNNLGIIIQKFIFRLISLFFLQAIAKMVITQKNILTSSKKSMRFFFKNIVFFIILSVVIILFNQSFSFILSFNKMGIINKVILTSVNTYTNLLLSAIVLINFLNSKKSSSK